MWRFEWLAAGPVPAEYDLRRLGWRLAETTCVPVAGETHLLLARPATFPLREGVALAEAAPARRMRTLLLGVADSIERARLLRLGFGDAVPPGVTLAELEARALRRIEQAETLPRRRTLGSLRLELSPREGFVAGRPLGLHPREFELLWRLADAPGEAMSASALLGEIWRLSFRPETNSLAVHVSRLRAKLRLSGLDGLIETTPDGGYRLSLSAGPAIPLRPAGGKLPLDAHVRLGEERGHTNGDHREQDRSHAL